MIIMVESCSIFTKNAILAVWLVFEYVSATSGKIEHADSEKLKKFKESIFKFSKAKFWNNLNGNMNNLPDIESHKSR